MGLLKLEDTIGLASPCWLSDRENKMKIKQALKTLGFRVKFADKMYANGWGYAASSEERVESIHSLVKDDNVTKHIKNIEWKCIVPGVATGELSVGYLDNYVYLANGGWIVPEKGKDYILCLEEHEMFFGIEHVSDEIARLENSPIMKQTKGILFGEYSKEPNQYLLNRLKVLGERYNIPVAYCSDFGHGINHGILEIGAQARLDTIQGELFYL